MRRVAIVIIVLVLIVWAGCRRRFAEDEGPIIVKNGSMTIDSADNTGKWNDDGGGSYSHDTDNNAEGHLWVLVRYKNSSFCPANGGQPAPAQGDKVDIDYSNANFKPTFKVVGNNPPRTKVPKNGLNKESDKRLRHGQAGDGEYITGVEVDNQPLNCQITKDNLEEIKICSVEAKCKEM